MVWSAFSAKKVYGRYFFTENAKLSTYSQIFLAEAPMFRKQQKFYFQQDCAPPHRNKEVQTWLKLKFGDRFIKSAQWPPRLPDHNPCDVSLWGTLKQKVYNPRPANVEELTENIKREFKIFKKTDKKSIFLNLKKRLVFLEQECGDHIEHLVFFF